MRKVQILLIRQQIYGEGLRKERPSGENVGDTKAFTGNKSRTSEYY